MALLRSWTNKHASPFYNDSAPTELEELSAQTINMALLTQFTSARLLANSCYFLRL
jgi:hypothetical protein